MRSFVRELEEAARKFSRQKISDDLWAVFASSIFYHRSEFDSLEGYQSLAKRLDELDGQRGNSWKPPLLSLCRTGPISDYPGKFA